MDSHELTAMLVEWKKGDNRALEKLYPLVENELRRIAKFRLSGERRNHTLQTTALINEAFVRLFKGNVDWQGRAHFYAVCARVMRRILINYARDAKAARRGGGAQHLNIDDVATISAERSQLLLDLEDALKRLAEKSKVKADIVEMRYFGGMTIEEAAEVLGISPSSVSLHWRLARAWLQRELSN
jgi:RNA polymerase sigma factor (TIGR02999 family)